jgi:endonuclease/exonuclease/phosphatase (EEP) superfamily protein YafD
MTAVAAVWLGFVVAHRLLTGRHWVWLLADLVPPLAYLVVPLLLLAGAAATGSAVPAGLAIAALLLGAGHSGVGYGSRSVAEPGRPVRLVSWNTQYWHQHVDADVFYRFLRGLDADVYVLQEYVHGPHHALTEVDDRARLRSEFPGHHMARAGELITLSRFPIVATPPVAGATRVLRTDLRVGESTLSVYNVHIPVQYVPGDRLFAGGYGAELRSRHDARAAEFDGLAADLDTVQGPVVVAGDFNSTGAMGEMRGLFTRLTPANRAMRRHPYPASWPAAGPALWQLDWAFTAGVGLRSYRFLPAMGLSDHRAQELHLTVPQHSAAPSMPHPTTIEGMSPS